MKPVGGAALRDEWVIDQYRVKTDKRSGILNDPNRADEPQYIVRLIGKVISVSLETVKIVEGLPGWGLRRRRLKVLVRCRIQRKRVQVTILSNADSSQGLLKRVESVICRAFRPLT